jgi:hypothetical protein
MPDPKRESSRLQIRWVDQSALLHDAGKRLVNWIRAVVERANDGCRCCEP